MTIWKDKPIQLCLDLPDVEQPRKTVSAIGGMARRELSPEEAERLKIRKTLAQIRNRLCCTGVLEFKQSA